MTAAEERATPLTAGLPIDDGSAPLYTVGQVAGMLDVQPAYLRRLEAEGLVRPERSMGNQRRYSRDEIHLIQHVTSMVAEGLTLAGIRRLLVLEQQLTEVRRQLEDERAKRSSPGNAVVD